MRIIHLVAAGLAALVLTACSTAPRNETDIVVVKPVPPTRVVVVKPAPPPHVVVKPKLKPKPYTPGRYVKKTKTVITTRRY
jgi:hypothetical protein